MAKYKPNEDTPYMEFKIDRWLTYGIDIENRRISIDEELDEYSCGWAKRAVDLMVDTSYKPINVTINTCGGNCYDALSLYDKLRGCGCEIHTHASGKVMSAGIEIFLAGDIRSASENVTFMLHSAASWTEGKVYQMVTDTEEIKRLNEVGLKIYADRTEQPISFWKKYLKYKDRYLDILGAFELGIVNDFTNNNK